MYRMAWFVTVLVIAAATSVSALAAQSFRGTGQEATELFALEEGLVVFELEHEGSGAFSVRLLDEQGSVVEELARASGPFGGSKAVRVPMTGRYLLDVSATGPWSVRRRDPAAASTVSAAGTVMPDSTSPVYRAAVAAAEDVSTNSWLAGGFAGGVLAGPIGAAVAVGLAARSDVPAPPPVVNGPTERGPGFDAAFEARVRESRRKKAFIGGMLGSGIFLAGLVWALDIASGGEGGGTVDPGPGDGQFIVVPR